MDERAETIRAAIDAITGITDPAARAKAATEAMDVIQDGTGRLAKARRQDIAALRAARWSYRKIADAIGVHFTRVRQIESGSPTGNSSRGREASRPVDE